MFGRKSEPIIGSTNRSLSVYLFTSYLPTGLVDRSSVLVIDSVFARRAHRG